MQRYYITDGQRYIRKVHTRYETVSSASLADIFTLRKAQNILRNSLCKEWQRKFYCEGINDFSIVKPDLNNNSSLYESGNEGCVLDVSILDNIENCVQNIIGISVPDRQCLFKFKSDLEDAIKFYDRACSDIRHWIKDHKPPAHIETKAYGIQHNFEVERSRVKENYGFVIALINAEEESYTYDQLVKSLKERVYEPYTPNTYVYGLLEKLIS